MDLFTLATIVCNILSETIYCSLVCVLKRMVATTRNETILETYSWFEKLLYLSTPYQRNCVRGSVIESFHGTKQRPHRAEGKQVPETVL